MCFIQLFTKSRRMNSKTFSQAGPKRCQWKIDVWIRESFRRQNGSDAGPESFELRVFLRGLRPEATLIGCSSAAWCIQKRFNQRFCIATALTQKSSHGHCLEDVAILAQGKRSCRLQPSSQLDFQRSEMVYLVVSQMLELHYPSKLCVSFSFHQIQANEF